MKKIIILTVLLLAVTMPFCKKENPAPKQQAPSTSPTPSSSIHHYVLQNMSVSSVNSFTYNSSYGCDSLPIPSQKTDSLSFGLTAAGPHYFEITAQTFTPNATSQHYCLTSYILRVGSIQANDSVLFSTNGGTCFHAYNSGDTIVDNGSFDSATGFALLKYPLGICNITGTFYVAFKLVQNSGTHLGWMKVERFGLNALAIKELAYNQTPGQMIICGQTQ